MKKEIELLVATLRRTTNKNYPKLTKFLSEQEDVLLLREVSSLAHDLDDALQQSHRDGNRDAWQRGRIL